MLGVSGRTAHSSVAPSKGCVRSRPSFHGIEAEVLRRVLIADDSRVVRKAVCSLFASGFSVAEAEDGRQAIDNAKQMRPDLIVLDFSMPVMNGIQAAKALKQIMPHVPIILFTGHASTALEEEAFAAGIAALVSKDQDISNLITHVQALLGVRQQGTKAYTLQAQDLVS
jgi:CheY-like chemotaxis protein